MRFLELLIAGLVAITSLGFVFGFRPSRRAVGWIAGGVTGAVVAHILLEGIRWQMLASYGVLTLGLFLLWLRGSARSGSPRKRNIVRRLAAAGGRYVLLPVLAFVAILLPATMPVPKPWRTSGPHPIGVTDFTVLWLDRPEILTEDPGDHRELLVRAWYPSTDNHGSREPYMTDAEAGAFAASLGSFMPGGGLLYSQSRFGLTNSVRDADLSAAEGSFPVLVFSHGYTSYVNQNTPLMEELASHGYVVFSLGHTYDASVVFPDGRVRGFGDHVARWMETAFENQEELLEEMEILVQSEDPATRRELLQKQIDQARRDKANRLGVGLSWDIWVEDRLRFFEVLEGLQSGTRPSRFTGRLDLETIGLFGMSFGGATAAEVCHLDPRCRAAINIDGGHMYGYDSDLLDGNISKPLLMVHSSDMVTHVVGHPNNPDDYQAYTDFHYEPVATRGTRNDVIRIRIDGTSHLHLSDMSLLVRWIPGVASRTPGPRIAEILNRCSLAFFDEYLRGIKSPLLDGPAEEFPEVTFQTFGR
jgi:predicted dienelactone hydrolase